jgi:hypothetical protein
MPKKAVIKKVKVPKKSKAIKKGMLINSFIMGSYDPIVNS